jgi:pentatricopeptide repeat protein
MNLKRMIGIFFFVLAIPLFSEPVSESVYSVQIAAYPNQEEAQNTADEFIQKGFSPVFIVNKEGEYAFKVRWGNFETLAQAKIFRNHAANDLPNDAFVVSEPFNSAISFEEIKSPVPSLLPFDLALSLDPGITYQTDYEPAPPLSPEVSALLLRTDINFMNDEELLQKGANTGDPDQAIPLLEFGIEKFASSSLCNKMRLQLMRKYLRKKDFDKCAALLNYVKLNGIPEDCARACLQEAYMDNKKGERNTALAKFEQCTKDNSLPVKDRMDSAMRVATLYHVKRDYPTSYMIYRGMARSNAPMNVKAFCEMQIMGQEMELARSEKGKLDECIELADAICGKYPDAPRQVLSTIKLMQLECHFHKKEYERTLELIAEHRQQYLDQKREYWLTVYWEGCSLGRLGRYDEAIEVFQKYMNMDLPPGENFANRNPRMDSADWFSWLYKKKGDAEKSEYWRQELQKIRQEVNP